MDTKNSLNLVTCYNQSFSPLTRHLCRTISHPQIKIQKEFFEFGSEGFRTPGWYKFVRMKVQILQEMLQECEYGFVVGMIDSDVQCFDPKSVIQIWKMMIASEYDYVGFAEIVCTPMKGLWFEPIKEDANTGLVLIRKNERTESFLKQVLSKTFEDRFLGDQNAINESLRHFKLKRALLNPCLFTNGTCKFPKKETILHHATCTNNSQQKMKQMDWYRQQMGLNPVLWDDPSFGDY